MKTSLNFIVLIFGFFMFCASGALASSKVCFGSTKSVDTKGLVLKVEVSRARVDIKTIKGNFYNGSYPAYHRSQKARDGKVYMEYKGQHEDYQDVIMVDENLLDPASSGLLQVRARGEGYFNLVFVCKAANI